jgi:glutaconate CoA-transferase subunit A
MFGFDTEHFKTYAASAGEENGWQAYMEKFVAGGEAHYQQQVGGLDAIRALPLPTY